MNNYWLVISHLLTTDIRYQNYCLLLMGGGWYLQRVQRYSHYWQLIKVSPVRLPQTFLQADLQKNFASCFVCVQIGGQGYSEYPFSHALQLSHYYACAEYVLFSLKSNVGKTDICMFLYLLLSLPFANCSGWNLFRVLEGSSFVRRSDFCSRSLSLLHRKPSNLSIVAVRYRRLKW